MAAARCAPVDPLVLYEASVQDIKEELDFAERIYREANRRPFRALREDFCGTAALAAAWVRRGPENSAIGIDLHRRTLAWAHRHHVAPLGPAASRIRLVCDDVLRVPGPKVDLVAAFNFSYSVFKSRELLRRYFHVARGALTRGGLLILDAFGGTAATEVGEERRCIGPLALPGGRLVPRFTYVWEQIRFNPVDHRLLCNMHFELPGGIRIKRAFAYDWRYWTLPELREIMLEAGFKEIRIYVEGWDEKKNKPTGIYRRRSSIGEMASWLAYVVGFAG